MQNAKARPRVSTEAVLDLAWDAGDFGADHVIERLGLTRSTALSALDALIDLGLVRELPSVPAEVGNRMGRPARRFQLDGGAGVVVGVDAGDHRFTATVADLSGRSIAQRRVAVRGTEAAGSDSLVDERRAAAFEVIDLALAAAGRSRADVAAVAVGIPAPVDGDGGSPSHAIGFWPQMNAGLQGVLSGEFPVVRLENDAALAAVAESSLGDARGHKDFVAMLVGRRLGAGVFLEGRLIRGGHGAVGELGALAYVSGVGSSHGFGYLAEQWLRRALGEGRVPADHAWARLAGGDFSAQDVLGAAALGDPVSRPLLEELGRTLGQICRVVARFYDPSVIVVCGAMADALVDVIDIARDLVEQDAELPVPEIVASGLGGDVVSLGAVSAAREAARGIALPMFSARAERATARARA